MGRDWRQTGSDMSACDYRNEEVMCDGIGKMFLILRVVPMTLLERAGLDSHSNARVHAMK